MLIIKDQRRFLGAFGAMLVAACVRQPLVTTPVPVPTVVPAPQTGTPTLPSPTQETRPIESHWTFSYIPGDVAYSITTEASITLLSDLAQKRVVPTTIQRVTLAVSQQGDVQLVDPTTPVSSVCDSTAALATHALHLIPKIPAQLTTGFTWTDTVHVEGCLNTIPTATSVAHTYTVQGDTTFNGVQTLHIMRTDTLSARGEGNEGQHRVLLTAAGRGTADLFFDVPGGKLLGSITRQDVTLDVVTSGRLSRFAQRVTEQIVLAQKP